MTAEAITDGFGCVEEGTRVKMEGTQKSTYS